MVPNAKSAAPTSKTRAVDRSSIPGSGGNRSSIKVIMGSEDRTDDDLDPGLLLLDGLVAGVVVAVDVAAILVDAGASSDVVVVVVVSTLSSGVVA